MTCLQAVQIVSLMWNLTANNSNLYGRSCGYRSIYPHDWTKSEFKMSGIGRAVYRIHQFPKFCGRYGEYDAICIAYNVFQTNHYNKWIQRHWWFPNWSLLWHWFKLTMGPGPLFCNRTNVLPQDLEKPRSHWIRIQAFSIALEFGRHLWKSESSTVIGSIQRVII